MVGVRGFGSSSIFWMGGSSDGPGLLDPRPSFVSQDAGVRRVGRSTCFAPLLRPFLRGLRSPPTGVEREGGPVEKASPPGSGSVERPWGCASIYPPRADREAGTREKEDQGIGERKRKEDQATRGRGKEDQGKGRERGKVRPGKGQTRGKEEKGERRKGKG